MKWLPDQCDTADGQERRVGIEIELAGLDAATILHCVTELFGGDVKEQTPLEYLVDNTEFGEFKIELDASQLQELARVELKDDSVVDQILDSTRDYITRAAEQLVPWEIVSPPIKLSQLEAFNGIVPKLRSEGALGTRHAIHYAFGVHYNPEVPALKSSTIVSYLKAYVCLYDWIRSREKIDTTRRFSAYAKHFDTEYIQLLVASDYQPDLDTLIDDYLDHNPTRNRSMDMLPMFTHIDEQRVRSRVDDHRIKARPTFHYRLPNCDVDDPDWDLSVAWRLWLAVEKLASDEILLDELCHHYSNYLNSLTAPLLEPWTTQVTDFISQHLPQYE